MGCSNGKLQTINGDISTNGKLPTTQLDVTELVSCDPVETTNSEANDASNENKLSSKEETEGKTLEDATAESAQEDNSSNEQVEPEIDTNKAESEGSQEKKDVIPGEERTESKQEEQDSEQRREEEAKDKSDEPKSDESGPVIQEITSKDEDGQVTNNQETNNQEEVNKESEDPEPVVSDAYDVKNDSDSRSHISIGNDIVNEPDPSVVIAESR